MIWPLFRYILMAAGRDRFFLSLAGVLVVTISLAVFFGTSALIEKEYFAITFIGFGARLFGVTCLILFVVTFIRRSFEGRDIEYLLSRPIGRIRFVLTHAMAFSCLALLAAVLLGGVAVALSFSKQNVDGLLLWWGSIALEFIIMANVAMFFAFVMSSATACMMIVFTFYLLSRLIGEILGILANGTETGIMSLLAKIMEVISIFIPRLDMMGQTKWLIYGFPENIAFGFVAAQAVVFIAVVVAAAAVDMNRRQF